MALWAYEMVRWAHGMVHLVYEMVRWDPQMARLVYGKDLQAYEKVLLAYGMAR
jgi:hypothetical protein